MSGWKLDTEETDKQKPSKQRNRFRRDGCNNTDYTGRGLEISRSVSWNKELSETEPNPHCP